MAIAVKSQSKRRWVRDLHSAKTLADDLGVLGSWVGPRTGPMKRTNGQKEDYVLRRLLVAWKKIGRLQFPVHVEAETDRHGQPDFWFAWSDEQTLGIEITEAGEQDYQAWLTKTEGSADGAALEIPFEASTDRTVSVIRRVIESKVRKFDKGSYREPAECDLIVYDNTAWGGFLNNEEMLDKLGRPNDLTGRFRQVHLAFGEIVYLDIFGTGPIPVDISTEYEIDYARWVFEQVERIRHGATNELDLVHIAEELEDLGKSERRTLASQLRRLMLHMLKWQFQIKRRSRSWKSSITDARAQIHDLLTESPSLRPGFEDVMNSQYEWARRAAANETGLALVRFPDQCPYTVGQLADPDYMPDTAGETEDLTK